MNNKDSTGLILIGIIVGVVAFALLSRRTTITAQPIQHIQPPIINDWKPIDIPRVDDIKITEQKQIELLQMSSKLEKAASQLENATSKLQETLNKLQAPNQQPMQQSIQQPIQQPMQQPIQSSPQIIIQPIPIYPIYPFQPQQQPIQPNVQQTKEIDQTNQTKIQQNIEQSNVQSSNVQSQSTNTIYKNNERWKIIRGQDGRIKSLEIVRDVKKSK